MQIIYLHPFMLNEITYQLHRDSVGMDKKFHATPYDGIIYP